MTESIVEGGPLSWLGKLGYARLHGSEIAPHELAPERTSFGEVVLLEPLGAPSYPERPQD